MVDFILLHRRAAMKDIFETLVDVNAIAEAHEVIEDGERSTTISFAEGYPVGGYSRVVETPSEIRELIRMGQYD